MKEKDKNKETEQESKKKGILSYFKSTWSKVGLMIFFLIVFSILPNLFSPKQLTQTEFLNNLENNKYSEIMIPETGTQRLSITVQGVPQKDDTSNKVSYAQIFNTEKNVEKIESLALKNKTKVAFSTESGGMWVSIIFNVLTLGISVLIAFFLIRSLRGQGLQTGGETKAVDSSLSTVTFANIAGKHEEKEELLDIIDYFHNTEAYKERGLTIPRGILLEGPPGTGKTLLAKGLAGEINANFYTVSGSDFNGMFRGSGTSKVKSLFKNARENAPSVIFIDEIDAVGNKRGAGFNDKDSDQTLNQILVELDGFNSGDEQVVILGATNLSEKLDPALLRSGRFDRKIYVGLPNTNERKETLEYYLKNKPVSDNVSVSSWTEQLQGFSGADIASLINEANLISFKAKHSEITQDDLNKAFNKVVAGVEKKSTVYNTTQKEIIANHESGHALVGALLEGGKKVKKVTIIPHGRAGGFAMMIPKDEMFVHTKDYIENTIVTLLAGRGAEELLSNTQTTGVSQDIKEATELARNMITSYGMHGSLQFLDNDFVDKQELQKDVDTILNSSYDKAKQVISDNIPRITLLSKTLIAKETLLEDEIDYIVSLDNEHISEHMDTILEQITQDDFDPTQGIKQELGTIYHEPKEIVDLSE